MGVAKRRATGRGRGPGPAGAGRLAAIALLTVACLAIAGGVASANPAVLAGMAGNGTADDPYVITNATELQAVESNLSAHYALGGDVDASTTATWNGGAGFDPVGNDSQPFTGTFDGRGHRIEGLTIDRPNETHVGLFGVVGRVGTVRNVTVVDATVAGENGVGTIAGESDGTVADAVANATVTGTFLEAGGLVGHNLGEVRRSRAHGSVAGRVDVGGLVGRNDGTVADSHAAARVDGGATVGGLVGFNDDSSHPDGAIVNGSATGDVDGRATVGGLVGDNQGAVDGASATGAVNGTQRIGGLVGINDGSVDGAFATGTVTGSSEVGGLTGNGTGTATGAYWDVDATGQATSAHGRPRETDEMTGRNALRFMTPLDFFDTWTVTAGYPVHQYRVPGRPPLIPGSGTAADPYVLSDVYELQYVRHDLAAHYALGGDVDASPTASWHAGRGFRPLGNSSQGFAGSLDGRGHAVDGLTIDRPSAREVGLFGATDAGATVENVTLANASVTADSKVGALVGTNRGTVADAVANATVTAGGSLDFAGGLVGQNFGDVVRSAARGEVSGSHFVGGLAAENAGTVSRSSATATVDGSVIVGGLVGENRDAGVLADVYATGNVNGSGVVGGLVGENGAEIRETYAAGGVNASDRVGGLIGRRLNGTTVADSYWDVDATGRAAGVGDGNESGTTGLRTPEMTGPAARTNMTALDLGGTWIITESYPALAWQDVEPFEPTPFFAVTIADVNASVAPGNAVSVAYLIENTGDVADVQNVTFAVDGRVVDTRADLALEGESSTTGTFTAPVDRADAPEIEVAVASENDTATRRVPVAVQVGVVSAIEYGGTVEVVLDRTARTPDGENLTDVAAVEVFLDGTSRATVAADATATDGGHQRLAVNLTDDLPGAVGPRGFEPARNLTLAIPVESASSPVGTERTLTPTVTLTAATARESAADSPPVGLRAVLVYEGAQVAVRNDASGFDTEYGIEGVFRDTTGPASDVAVVDTGALSLRAGGSYRLEHANGDRRWLNVSSLRLAVAPVEPEVDEGEPILVNASAARGSSNATATLSDAAGDRLETRVLALSPLENVTFDFGSRSADGSPYRVTVVDNATGIDESVTVAVASGDDRTATPTRTPTATPATGGGGGGGSGGGAETDTPTGTATETTPTLTGTQTRTAAEATPSSPATRSGAADAGGGETGEATDDDSAADDTGAGRPDAPDTGTGGPSLTIVTLVAGAVTAGAGLGLWLLRRP